MSKVKKRRGVTGVRNTKRRPAAIRGVGQRAEEPRAAARSARAARAPAVKGRSRPVVAPRRPLAPIANFRFKVLDPQRKCGAGTSVQFLCRVDELVDGRSTPHLVYHDRHGWYCEHGPSCAAVAPARKFSVQHARMQ